MADRRILELACRTRALELELLELFKAGKLAGTVHTYVGQELCAASFAGVLEPERDAVFATHRGHGWYLASGGPLDAFFAELMGREGALCHGRGGSQHLHHGHFFSSGIQGGSALLATGWAWAKKRQGRSDIAIAQVGDGTLGEGAFYEALTFASLFAVPVLFVLEWNGCAQSTDTHVTTPGDLVKRVEGFGIAVDRRDDRDPDALHGHLGEVVRSVRAGRPFVQVIDTRRLMPHSKGDENRSAAALDALWREDPLTRLIELDAGVRSLFDQAREEMSRVAASVSARPLVPIDEASAWPKDERRIASASLEPTESTGARVVEELNEALARAMEQDERVMLLGEDLVDPYGGAFKVTKGLSTKFPERVFSTPIAEAAIVGVANGLALGGMRPLAEIMFADFVTLAVDQIVNHAAKVHSMYGGLEACPVVVRMPSGGRRGYGPTHSQSMEGLFLGVPGLRVVACSRRHAAGNLLAHLALHEKSPTIFVENKLLYAAEPAVEPPLDLERAPSETTNGDYPPLCFRPAAGHAADVTVVTYGGMVDLCEEAMRRLVLEDELRFDYIVLTQLWPLTTDEIVASVERTGRLVVAEEGVAEYGVGAGVISAVAQRTREPLRARAVGMRPVAIPCARHLEDRALPSVEDVVAAVRALQ